MQLLPMRATAIEAARISCQRHRWRWQTGVAVGTAFSMIGVRVDVAAVAFLSGLRAERIFGVFWAIYAGHSSQGCV